MDGRKGWNFHDKCDNKGETITVVYSTGGILFLYFLINHVPPLGNIASMVDIYFSP